MAFYGLEGLLPRRARPPSGNTSLASNDQGVFQADIDGLWQEGGGLLLIPALTYYVPQFIWRAGVAIMGSGEGSTFPDSVTGLTNGTIIRAPLGSTSHMLIPDPNAGETVSSPQLRDLTLDGNNGPVPGAFSYAASDGGGTAPPVFTVTGTTSALGGPSYSNGNQVQLSQGIPPAGYANGVAYYVVGASGTGSGMTVQLATTPGGTPANGTGTGTGVITQNPQQAPNAFDLIHIATKVIRFKIANVTLYGAPQDALSIAGSSMGGSFVIDTNVQHAYRSGLNVPSASDLHFTNFEVGPVGQCGAIVGGTQVDFANAKTNTCGLLGLGAGTEDGWQVTGGTNVLKGTVSENNANAFGRGRAFYVSGNRNEIDVTANGAGDTCLYLDGCVYNEIKVGVSSITNNAQPNYIYTINTAATKNNRVRTKGINPGTPMPVIAYANLTGGGTETNNHFLCENEDPGARQSLAYAASITPDPYLGGTVKIGTITGPLAIANPANGHAGSQMMLQLAMDATGHPVTFGTAYTLMGPVPVTPSSTTVLRLSFDGVNWNETGRDCSPAATAPVVTGYTPADPAGTVSTALVMMGLGSTAAYTPTVTGKLRITITGVVSTATASAQIQFSGRYGTGTAPVNGAASTGTTIGAGAPSVQGPVNDGQTIVVDGVVSGLALGTPVWIDVALKTANASDQATLQKVSVTITETN